MIMRTHQSTSFAVISVTCLLVVAALLLASSTSHADGFIRPLPPPTPEMRLYTGPRQLYLLLQTESVIVELSFTAEQRAKLAEAHKRWVPRFRAFPDTGSQAEQDAWHLDFERNFDEFSLAIEQILSPPQKTRLDGITLQLFLPYLFHAGCGLDLDERLALTPQQRRRVYRYHRDHVTGVCEMYGRGDAADRASYDGYRAEERTWRAALLAELTAEQQAELKSLGGKQVSLGRLQEQLWTACLAEARSRGASAQDPRPELFYRLPSTGRRLGWTSEQLAEIRAFHEELSGPTAPTAVMPTTMPAQELRPTARPSPAGR